MGFGAWLRGAGREPGSAQPGARWLDWDGVTARARTAAPVTRAQAMGLPGVGRGVRLIADVIGSMAPDAVRWLDDANTPVEVLARPPLLADPDPDWHPRTAWLAAAARDLALDGNVFADKAAATDRLGYPLRLPLVAPDLVEWDPATGRYLVGAPGGQQEWEPGRMFHAAVDVDSGTRMGVGLLAAHQDTLRLIREVEHATYVVMRDGKPAGVLTVDDDLDDQELAGLKAAFLNGVRGDGVAALRRSTFQGMSWSAADLALVPARGHNMRLAADITGVPGYLLGVPSESRVYSNMEDEWSAFVRVTVQRYADPLQGALTRCLPRGQFVRFPVDRISRPGAEVRWRNYATAVGLGAMTVAEVRQDEGLGPLQAQPEGAQP